MKSLGNTDEKEKARKLSEAEKKLGEELDSTIGLL